MINNSRDLAISGRARLSGETGPAARAASSQRGSQVVVFNVESLEPPLRPRPPKLRLGLLGQGQEVCRMPGGLPDPELLGDGRPDQEWVTDRGQRHQECAVAELVHQRVGGLAAMRRGADARGPCRSMPTYPSPVAVGSPVWTPMRTRTGSSSGHWWRASERCAATAAATASLAVGKAAKMASPWVSAS
jgi:hypothetical protein